MGSPTTEPRTRALKAPAGTQQGFETPLWRAVSVFRIAALGYAATLIVTNGSDYARHWVAWVVLAVMTAWTVYTVFAFGDPDRRGSRSLLLADLAVSTGCLLATGVAERPHRVLQGASTTPSVWVAGAALAWGVSGGRRQGAIAAAVLGVAGISLPLVADRGFNSPSQSTLNGVVLLFLCGVVAGHVSMLGRTAETRLAQAIELEAATRERERLARDIHDSVLQVLTLVKRRGGALGGEAAELGRLAGEQEVALRALIGGGGGSVPDAPLLDEDGRTDLRSLLTGYESATVTVSAPATAVRVPGHMALEIKAAVGAALDNVRGHCGETTRAWVLIEDSGPAGEDAVTVSVRDEGPGIPPGRLSEAVGDGRLGVAQSIQGRIRDLGGTVTITSSPGQGTEIEMVVPSS